MAAQERSAKMPTNRYNLLAIVDDVTSCDCCGKSELKCTMALEELDADGNALGEVYFGRDCGARALGWRVSADRAEKLVRGTARMDYYTLSDVWRAHASTDSAYRVPATVEIDGAQIEVIHSSYQTVSANQGWTRQSKTDRLYWRVARAAA